VTALVDGAANGASVPTRAIVQAAADTDLTSGDRIGLTLPSQRTYFFDAETGEALAVSGVGRERLAL
jgi:sn-glycerol 3-phosphate transport system ATP-binding protein